MERGVICGSTLKVPRRNPCDGCANRDGCKVSFKNLGCHYFPEWGSPVFDRIRDCVRKQGNTSSP